MSESSAPAERPASVWIIFLVLLLQGTAVIITTIRSMMGSSAEVLDAAGQLAMVVLYVLGGVVLMVLGWQLFAGRAGARTPTMVLQLLIVVLSFSFFAGGEALVGVLFLLPAAAVLVLLFVAATGQWLQPSGGSI